MTPRGWLAVAVLAVGALALWTADDVRQPAPAATASAPRAEVPPAVPADVVTAPHFPGSGSRRVRAALDRQIAAAGLTGRIDDGERAALLAALADVRRSARREKRRTRPDPAAEAAHARTVVAADRLFRERLGVGIAAFLAAQGPPGRIEDLGAVDVAAAEAAHGR
jgi:uncharacterized membrane protein YebE (DUF533 family)